MRGRIVTIVIIGAFVAAGSWRAIAFPCGSHDSCEPDETCIPFDGFCRGADPRGFCAFVPSACSFEIDPVCGCDGITYQNACWAINALTGIAYQGSCVYCGGSAGNCFDEWFCVNEPGDCVGQSEGLCLPSWVIGCAATCPLACGCDGTTYDSPCHTLLFDAGLAHTGPCDDPTDGIVTGVGFDASGDLQWFAEQDAVAYNVRRRGITWSCFVPGVSGTSTPIPGTPAPGQLWPLLVTAVFAGGEGSLGVDSSCAVRAAGPNCP